MKYRKVNEDIAMEDIIIQDENIAEQIIQIKKQINDKLKRVAQIQSEIAVHNQNIAALQNKAIQAQKNMQISSKSSSSAQSEAGSNAVNNEGIMPTLSDFVNEDEDRFGKPLGGDEEIEFIDNDSEIDNNEDGVFFVEIPAQDEDESEIIAKVFRKEDDQEWYIRDTIGDAYFLDDLVFHKDWDKVEIIGYLADIFGDVIEIDRNEFDDIIDDKEETDAQFFD